MFRKVILVAMMLMSGCDRGVGGTVSAQPVAGAATAGSAAKCDSASRITIDGTNSEFIDLAVKVFRNIDVATVDDLVPVRNKGAGDPDAGIDYRFTESLAVEATVQESLYGSLEPGSKTYLVLDGFQYSAFKKGDRILFAGVPFDETFRKQPSADSLWLEGDIPEDASTHVFAAIYLVDGNNALVNPFDEVGCPRDMSILWPKGTTVENLVDQFSQVGR